MLKNLSYKHKNRLLLAVAVIFAIMSYYLAFEKTFDLRTQCSEMKNELSIASMAPERIANLEMQLRSIEGVIGGQTEEGIDPQQQLLEFVTNYCEEQRITLQEFPQPISHEEEDYAVETNIFVVRGNFIKLLNMTYALEQEMRIGKVVSVKYKSKKNLRTKRLDLKVTVYLQNVRKLDT